MGIRKLGVEEELLLVDPSTGRLTALAERALRGRERESARRPAPEPEVEIEHELFMQQIEVVTEPCLRLDDLTTQLRRGRRALTRVVADAGAAAVAVASPVLDGDVTVTPDDRYRRIQHAFGELTATALACAMHVHVDVTDDDEGVRVLDAIRPWLPVLLAVSANSPYAYGRDTGYASWRSQVWGRWPSHGSGEAFGSPAAYDEVTGRLVEWGAALDDGMVYFDARLSRSYPTVEIRVADVCTDLDDAALVAALSRALVETVAARPDDASRPWRGDLLRAAHWRAGRHGLGDQLVHPADLRLAPAREVVTALIDHTRDALTEAGDLDHVEHLVEQVLARGNGAVRQRRAFEEHGHLVAVVDDLIGRTEQSAGDD